MLIDPFDSTLFIFFSGNHGTFQLHFLFRQSVAPVLSFYGLDLGKTVAVLSFILE